jgi:DNA polymerase III delta subunit
MAKKADVFPPLLVVSGGQEYLRRRFLKDLQSTQRNAGWVTVSVDGSIGGAVQDVLAGDPFHPVHTLAVVTHPEKVPLELLEQHQGSKGPWMVTLLLHVEGEPDGRSKFGKAVKGPWSSVHKTFLSPPEWQASKVGVEFIQEEATKQGLTWPLPLATVLVERAGTDLGTLSFEVHKIGMLAKLAGASTVDVSHVRGGMAPIAEASAFPILEALASKNVKKLLRALLALRRSSRDDPTMRVSRLIVSTVTKWFQATYLTAMPPRVAAEELGVHPWVYESKIIPAVQCWGRTGSQSLLMDLAVTERAVLNGALNPWTVLMTRLLAASSR